MCYENGGMIDDGTVFRLGQNNFRWIGGDDYSGIWLREQAEKMGYKAWVRSSTDQLHNIAVQGPNSRELMKEIIWTAPAQPAIGELEWFRFAVGRIGISRGRRLSSRAPAIPASLAMRSSVIRRMRSPCSTQFGKPARNMA
jgi:aminomethyltransferase